MWARREVVTFAVAATVTSGLTLGIVYPRTVAAVDAAASATTEVKTPALDLGASQVSAARDEKDAQLILLTVKNKTDKPVKAEFSAQLMEMQGGSPRSRVLSISMEVWSQEYVCELKPGETQTLKITLPAQQVAEIPLPNGQTATTLPPSRYLALTDAIEPKNAITALTLPPQIRGVELSAVLPKAPS